MHHHQSRPRPPFPCITGHARYTHCLSRVPRRCGRPVAWPSHLPVEGKAVKNRHGRAAVTGRVQEIEPPRAQKRHWQVTDRGRPAGKAGLLGLESEDLPGRFTASAVLPLVGATPAQGASNASNLIFWLLSAHRSSFWSGGKPGPWFGFAIRDRDRGFRVRNRSRPRV